MKRVTPWTLVLGAALALWLAGRAPGGATAAVSADLARSAAWDDGNAEFSVYDATGRFEGQERAFTARILVVKEDFVRGSLVKSDHGPVPGKTFEVLKLNYLHDVPTGTYAFHQMASVFFDRESFLPVKLAASSMEACGLTYAVAHPDGNTLRHESHSYWDEEGDRQLALAWEEGAVFYDSLPLWLRGLDLTKRARYEVPLFPTQVRNRIGNPVLGRAEVELRGPDRARGGALAVAVRHPGGEDRLWFRKAEPRVLARWEAADGRVLVLRKTLRIPYWERTAPEDEELLR